MSTVFEQFQKRIRVSEKVIASACPPAPKMAATLGAQAVEVEADRPGWYVATDTDV